MANDQDGLSKYGRYRRIFESYIFGKRINQLSWGAEAFFWRCYVIADDYGNFPVEPLILMAKAGGLRRMTPEECTGFVKEMESKGLILLYLVNDDDWYGHFIEFTSLQPPTGPPRGAGLGRRRQWPESPWDNSIPPSMQPKYTTSKGGPPSASDKALYNDNDKDETSGPPASRLDPSVVKGLEKRDFVIQAFKYWQEKLEHPNAKLSPERVRKLESRWKDSSLNEVKLAIDGCESSDFHMGRQPNNPTKYDDLMLICRDRSKVEWFGAKVKDKAKPIDDKKKRSDEAKRRWSKE